MNQEARKIVAGLGWVSAASYINRAFSFVTTLILARLLAPDQFGAVAVGGMMVEALKIFRDMGLGQALIYRKGELPEASDTALIMILGLNLGLFALAFVAAPWVAVFFHDPSLTPVLIVMSANLIPIGLRAVPDALIRKEGRFDKLAIPEVVPVLVSSIVGIVLAVLGFGVWSLVIRTVLASALAAILIWFFIDYRPRARFNLAVARELFHYGKFVVGATLLSVGLYNIDKLYLGKFAGVGDLGVYTMAWAISSIPVTEFGHLLCRVAFPVFCQVNGDAERLRQIFLGSFRYNALIVVPLGIGIAAFGPDLARLFLGEKWNGIGVALQILALASIVRAVSSLTHELFRATGRVRVVQTFTLSRLIAVAALGIPALKIGGVAALCWLIFASNVLVFGAEVYAIARALNSTILEILKPVVRALAMAIVSIGASYAVYAAVASHESLVQALFAAIVAVGLYAGVVFMTQRTLLTDARRLFARTA